MNDVCSDSICLNNLNTHMPYALTNWKISFKPGHVFCPTYPPYSLPILCHLASAWLLPTFPFPPLSGPENFMLMFTSEIYFSILAHVYRIEANIYLGLCVLTTLNILPPLILKITLWNDIVLSPILLMRKLMLEISMSKVTSPINGRVGIWTPSCLTP